MTASTPALEIVEHEIGSIEVNQDGSCRWTDVANALTHIRAQLSRLPAQAANEPSDALGRWLSAALDDPTVCAEMKADISAWFAAGQPLPAQAVGEGARSSKDFAIEHAEYMARAVDAFMDFLNKTGGAARVTDQGAMTEHWRGVQSCIYEFRKRAQRAALPSPPAEPSGEMVEAE